MRAYCLIRDQPVYRRDAFCKGLAACGYQVITYDCWDARPDDVLVIWNRYGHWHQLATRFEKNGGRVLVAENGYVANDRANRTRYAIALHAHNGQGEWFPGDASRWDALEIDVKPYRERGGHILVCPNRSFGNPGYIMDSMWTEKMVKRLERITKRTVRVRQHPGNVTHRVPLEQDLNDAWAVVIWSSSVGVGALIAGVPVFCECPRWIARGAASLDVRSINDPMLHDRMPSLHALAWAQWHITEIESGAPFQHLLHRPQAQHGGL